MEENGEKKGEKKGKKTQMKIVATTSLPAVDRPNADRWSATRSRQNAGHNMAIVGEPCNVDAYANIPSVFMTTD